MVADLDRKGTFCQTQSVPTIGPSDQFEIAYRPLLSAKLARFGLEVNYQHDLAGLDLGLHLYERRDHSPTTNAILSQVRVWSQAKGIRTDTLSAEQIDASASIAIEGLSQLIRSCIGMQLPSLSTSSYISRPSTHS